MRGRRRRGRPRVPDLAGRHDAAGLVRALTFRDAVVDNRDRLFDLGVPVRRHAALALATEPESEAVDIGAALIRALGDPSDDVRIWVARSLAVRGEYRAVPALLQGTLRWRDTAARVAAKEALLELCTPDTLEQVVQLVLADPSPPPETGRLLRDLSDKGGHEAARRAGNPAITAMGAGDEDLAWRGADVLVCLGMPSVEPLLSVLTDPAARVPAICALGRLADLRASEHLVEHLDDHDPAVRRVAAEALGRLADPSVTQALLPLTVDSDSDVRAAALAALQKLGPFATVHTAPEAEQGRPVVRPRASMSFGRVPGWRQ